jgi:chitin disaccharide deacetylase
VRRLIVNADDFGLTDGVNRAIGELHDQAVLTSSTLMAKAAATDGAIQIARSRPSLGIGCHVVLVDGTPVLSAHHEIPDLADPVTGRFPFSLATFLAHHLGGWPFSRFERQIEAEAKAQINLLQSKGLTLSHIDSHKHTHMFPTVLRPLLRAARAAGISAVRNPFEPAWAIHVTGGAPWARVAEVTALRWLEPVWRRILAEEGFRTTDGTIAVVGTGILDKRTLRLLLAGLPEGTWELVTHPGYNDQDLARIQTRLRASRQIEREALAAIAEYPDIELISFHGLATSPPLATSISSRR